MGKLFANRIHFIAIVAVLFAGMYGYFYGIKLNKSATVRYALEQIEVAIAEQNEPLFRKYVDVNSIANSILSQSLGEPEVLEGSEETGLLGMIESTLKERITQLVRPELAENVKKQIITFVNNGAFAQPNLLQTLYPKSAIVRQLWQELSGGSALTFSGIHNVRQVDNNAVADLSFYRLDLKERGSLKLSLVKKDDHWQLVGVNNLRQVLDRLNSLKLKQITEQNQKIRQKINKALKAISIQKSAGVNEWGVGKNIMLSIAFENSSDKEITEFKAKVQFIQGANNKVLREVKISDKDPIAPLEVLEKSWPMSINPLSENDEIIYNSKAGEVALKVIVNSIKFADGVELKLTQIQGQ